MTGQEERQEMARWLTVTRLANGIVQQARKAAGSPERAKEILPDLKYLLAELEKAAK